MTKRPLQPSSRGAGIGDQALGNLAQGPRHGAAPKTPPPVTASAMAHAFQRIFTVISMSAWALRVVLQPRLAFRPSMQLVPRYFSGHCSCTNADIRLDASSVIESSASVACIAKSLAACLPAVFRKQINHLPIDFNRRCAGWPAAPEQILTVPYRAPAASLLSKPIRYSLDAGSAVSAPFFRLTQTAVMNAGE